MKSYIVMSVLLMMSNSLFCMKNLTPPHSPTKPISIPKQLSFDAYYLDGYFHMKDLSSEQLFTLVSYGKQAAQRVIDKDGNNLLHMTVLLKKEKKGVRLTACSCIWGMLRGLAQYYTETTIEHKNNDGKTPFDLFKDNSNLFQSWRTKHSELKDLAEQFQKWLERSDKVSLDVSLKQWFAKQKMKSTKHSIPEEMKIIVPKKTTL